MNELERETLINDVIEYVLDTEQEDFYENPTQTHVYYLAYSIKYGELEACKILGEALNEQEN
jgi:hypothetical protein